MSRCALLLLAGLCATACATPSSRVTRLTPLSAKACKGTGLCVCGRAVAPDGTSLPAAVVAFPRLEWRPTGDAGFRELEAPQEILTDFGGARDATDESGRFCVQVWRTDAILLQVRSPGYDPAVAWLEGANQEVLATMVPR